MNSIVSALVGAGATGLFSWVIMAVRNRRKEKGDRIGDLRLDTNRRLDEQKADSERRFAAILDEIKAMETRLTAKFTSEIKSVESRLTSEIKSVESRLTEKITGEI
ncbi:MAG: hypothetical protein OXN79_04600, partial [bacterium]|nr:hypothetical protein [bacterium]